MFCKWCGGNLGSSDIKCARCGREVPARSDCGGFYDLVPEAKKRTQTQPARAAAPVRNTEQVHKPEPKAEPQRTKKSDRKANSGLNLITPVGLALVLLALIMLLGKVNSLQKKLDALSVQINGKPAASELIETSGAAETTEPEEASEPTDPAVPTNPTKPTKPDAISELADQDVKFIVDLGRERAALELGDYEDEFDTEYEPGEGKCSASYTLKEADTETSLEIEYRDGDTGWTASVSYDIDEELYKISDFADACQWQYRDKDGKWKDFSEDDMIQKDTDGKTQTTINKTKRKALNGGTGESRLELRCEIRLESTGKGSLTIEIEGIWVG